MVDRLPQLGGEAAYAKQAMRDKLIEHREYVTTHGEDMPEILGLEMGPQVGTGDSHGASSRSSPEKNVGPTPATADCLVWQS